MHMVVIDKRTFAIGLHWTLMKGIKTSSRADLAELALRVDKNVKFNLVAFYMRQAGFGYSGSVEHWAKARSLAACIEFPLPSFVGIFALDDVNGNSIWWVFARHNGEMLPFGDQSFPNPDEALGHVNWLRDFHQGVNFKEEIVCATVEESLAWLTPVCELGIFARFNEKLFLKPIFQEEGKSRFALYLLGLGVGLAAILGANAFMEYREEQNTLELARIHNAQRAVVRNQMMARAAEYFNADWQNLPLANEFGEKCLKAVMALPQVNAGWLFDSAACKERNIFVSWAHNSSSDYLSLPVNARLQSPKEAVTSFPLLGLFARSNQPYTSLLGQEQIKRIFYQICQTTSTRLRLSFEPSEKKRIDNVELIAPWVKGSWEFSGVSYSLALEGYLPKTLAQINGLTLDNITVKNKIWTFQGRVYAKQ